ncbi:hypothetical protein [Microbacterium arborescens]|uniref:hypothetical protein n=1 Tax=Microbacterium arborescens TaxID=33883 RepID=UPI00277E608B|nr:hypothetical protein [Microbacterium arborescens]MDQ1218048.1 hypothetical protein [Microbacterium arborescens]
MRRLRARCLTAVAAVSTVALIGVAVPAHATPTAAESVRSEAASPRAVEEILTSGDASVRAPGEQFHVLAHRGSLPAITGTFEFTVPDHVEVVGMQHQSQGQLAFTLHDDGRTARSVSSSVSMPNGIFMRMRLSEDAPPGAVLQGGAMRMLSPDGDPLAASTFTVTVLDLPIVEEHPVDVIVDVGSDAEFTTSASGDGVRTQWQVSADGGATWSDIVGATAATLRLEATTAEMNGWWYRAVHTNAAGSVSTDHAVLAVRTAPYFITNPLDLVVQPGDAAPFLVYAVENGGSSSMDVTWEMSRDGVLWEAYERGTFEELFVSPNLLFLNAVTAEMDGLRFRAVAENHLGRAVSDPALLTVLAAPVIDSHPADVRTLVGHDAVFRASTPAVSPDRTQQWQQRIAGGEWADIPGATQPEYSTGPTTLAMDRTEYRIVFTNAHGSTASEPATLTVRPSLPASVSVSPTVRLVDRLP